MLTLPPPARAATPAPAAYAFRLLAGMCEALPLEVTDGGHPTDTFGGTWWDTAQLTGRPEALRAVLDGESVRILNAYGHTARPDVAASRVLHHYLWSTGLLLGGPWYLQRRIPLIRPQELWIEPRTGTFAIAPGSFASPPGREASHAALRAAFAEFVTPLLAAFRPEIRRGPRALWGMAGDDLVSAVWYLGRLLGQERVAVREAAALLPDDTPPFPSGAGFRDLRGASGRSYATRTRAGCCLFYVIRPGEACLTCPRAADAERLRRLEG
ncbi:(2Fe-2S)-binding protein [Actinacidiphila soli]|uniref:(2Fe-2S)-binding protein n=1 Tax=Actinacidiphila soli TaxID=2487275 RepID=UPI000FCB3DCD|nr:(2Fe-2S)-binding protein [Actinacidiphila soli]